MPIIHTERGFRPAALASDECRVRIAWDDYRTLSRGQREWLDMVSWDIAHTPTHWEGSIARYRIDEILTMA